VAYFWESFTAGVFIVKIHPPRVLLQQQQKQDLVNLVPEPVDIR
jgi:hypothetical protein